MKNVLRFVFNTSVILFALPAFCQVDFNASQVRGCDSLSVSFTLVSGFSISKVRWDFGNGKTSSEVNPPAVLYSKPGSYTVTVTVNDTVIKEKPRYIQIRPSPVAFFQYADSSQAGILLYTFHSMKQPVDTALYSFQWRFQDQDKFDTMPDVLHIFDTTGVYKVFLRVTDDFGCADSVVRLVNASENLYVPNVFTPNEDGLNDILAIPVNGSTLYRFTLFTRYGVVIYKVESKFPSWDGRNAAGVKMPEGIYYYTIESLNQPHSTRQTGFVYLLR